MNFGLGQFAEIKVTHNRKTLQGQWHLQIIVTSILARQHIVRICHAIPSVCPSVTRVLCIKTAERIEILSLSDANHSSFSSPSVLA